MLSIFSFIVYLTISYLVADKIGRGKKIGFALSFILCILITPLFGYLLTENSAMKNPPGCKWCGNKENEAEYCAVCGKDEAGETRPDAKTK